MRFVLFTLLVAAMGWWARLVRPVRSLPLAAQAAVYFATGLVTLALETWVFTMVGIRWSILALAALPLGSAGFQPAGPPASSRRRLEIGGPADRMSAFLALAAIAIFASTVLSAAATSGDFFFFWGVKGQRFAQARMIDVEFLRQPILHAMHPDYPPLLTSYYAWTALGTGRALDWYGAMASSIFFLAGIALAAWGFTRNGAFTALLTSLCALLFIRNDVAGNAEPALIFFEVLALAALTASHEYDFVAAIALAGVVLTKVEGGAFLGIIVAFAWLLREGTWKERLLAHAKMSAFPLLVYGAWLVYIRAHGLTASHIVREGETTYAAITAAVARELALRTWYAPWIAALMLIACGRVRSAWPLAAASLTFILFLIHVYVRTNGTPAWSAGRVLITPLVVLLFAGMGAARLMYKPRNL